MKDVVVQVRELRRTFGKKRVLDGISMDLRAGCVTGFVGSNGAGKTTTLRAMLGLLPAEGHTLYLGRPLTAWRSPSRIVGAAFGGVGGHPKHRVRHHLHMVAAGAGVPDQRADELLEQVGMREAADLRLRIVSALSGQVPGVHLDKIADWLPFAAGQQMLSADTARDTVLGGLVFVAFTAVVAVAGHAVYTRRAG